MSIEKRKICRKSYSFLSLYKYAQNHKILRIPIARGYLDAYRRLRRDC